MTAYRHFDIRNMWANLGEAFSNVDPDKTRVWECGYFTDPGHSGDSWVCLVRLPEETPFETVQREFKSMVAQFEGTPIPPRPVTQEPAPADETLETVTGEETDPMNDCILYYGGGAYIRFYAGPGVWDSTTRVSKCFPRKRAESIARAMNSLPSHRCYMDMVKVAPFSEFGRDFRSVD